MNQSLASVISSGLKYLVGLAITALVSWNLLSPDDASAIDGQTAGVISTVAGFLAMIVTSVVQHLWAQKFPNADKGGSGAGSGGNLLPLLLLCGVAAALLPSCADYPITGGVFYRHPESGAKAGLTFEPGKAPTYSAKVPVYDPETGEQIGWAEVSGPLTREVKPEK